MESSAFFIDDIYEFSAPRYFDFISGETEEEMRNAELWFESALSYAPSPCMVKIKPGRAVQQVDTLCDFDHADESTKLPQISEPTSSSSKMAEESSLKVEENPPALTTVAEKNVNPIATTKYGSANIVNGAPDVRESTKVHDGGTSEENSRNASAAAQDVTAADSTAQDEGNQDVSTAEPPCVVSPKGCSAAPELLKRPHNNSKRMNSSANNPSAALRKMMKNQSQQSQAKTFKPTCLKSNGTKNSMGTPNLVQENQAIKRQKLDGGKSRQILSLKPPNFTHKSRSGAGPTKCSSSMDKTQEQRKIYVREQAAAAPFVSMAEMMNKFQSSTRGMSLSKTSMSDAGSILMQQGRPKLLTLTRPKEPDFETAQRIRPTRVKSSAEIEEEMMAKIPKFKARPFNKKIFEAPTVPGIKKSNPQPPEFQEFHLETMARASKNAEVSSVVSNESSSCQGAKWKARLVEPKPPVLQTSLRARPVQVKSSIEIEQEELEKIPKFKARPLNKKIFESKGDLGLFCNAKKQVTIPQEFHFSVDQRIPPPPMKVADLFDKLSISSESSGHDHQIPRNTKPNPFHLHTEERGMEKEKSLWMELLQKQIDEEKARIRKANPYPYTTDYPVIPPKPEPKPSTRPEPFPLESLVRHEEELQREMEERRRKEREEAKMRIFKAQPVLKEDPIPVPEKERKPLTQIQKFNLHLEHRSVDRAEFDKTVKEKQMLYKRYREEAEAAKQMEEEKALKQLRRTLVPHARPAPTFTNPFIPQKSSREITKAKSPKLRIRLRREKLEKQNSIGTAVTAASQLR